jgi:hypothetical protein
MHNEIAPAFLGGLSFLFGGYGVQELALAYSTDGLNAWRERALPGAGGIIVAALFAVMVRQVLG